jgi:hypothetical protein
MRVQQHADLLILQVLCRKEHPNVPLIQDGAEARATGLLEVPADQRAAWIEGVPVEGPESPRRISD